MSGLDIEKLWCKLEEVDAALRYGPPRRSEVERLLSHVDALRQFLAACKANRDEIEKILHWRMLR